MNSEEGKEVVKGIAIGQPYLTKKSSFDLNACRKITVEEVENEEKRLNGAIVEAQREIKFLKSNLDKKIEKTDLQILTVHLMMLEDPMYVKEIQKEIRKNLLGAECSVKRVTERFMNLFEKIADPIYKQRALDIKDVSERLINNLMLDIAEIHDFKGKILITDELMPSEILKMYENENLPEGIIMEYSGTTSHIAILAKALEIPTLMGKKNIFDTSWGDNMILDTSEYPSEIIIDPNEEDLKNYRLKKERLERIKKDIEKNRDLPTVTQDGVQIALHINTGGQLEEGVQEKKKPDGIGLLRTEMLYMNSETFPTEEEQYEVYEKIGAEMQGKPVIIRTLDIGADKQLPYYKIEREENPSLGVRGLRFSLENPEIFKEQLRAILRASADKNLKIMFPMVTTLFEVQEAKRILEEVKRELLKERKTFNENIEVGIMVEVPSVIFMADLIGEEVDFFSVGTNDLTQYILAADRFNARSGELYDPYTPSVIRAINVLAETAKRKNKKVSVCGEMAGEEIGATILLALGIKDLSMIPSSVLPIRSLIRKIDTKDLESFKEKILTAKNSHEVKEITKKFIENL